MLWDMARSKLAEKEKEKKMEIEDDRAGHGKGKSVLPGDEEFVKRVRTIFNDDEMIDTLSDDHIAKYLISARAARGKEEDAVKSISTTLVRLLIPSRNKKPKLMCGLGMEKEL